MAETVNSLLEDAVQTMWEAFAMKDVLMFSEKADYICIIHKERS
jgi:hypothetical protein